MSKPRCLVVLAILLSLFAFLGCEPGDYEYYSLNGSGSVSSCRVYYPASLSTSSGTYPAVTLSGGMTNSKEDMYWLAEHLSGEAEVIVFTISAANNMTVSGYTNAHLDGYDMMVAENNNSRSIVYQKISSYGLMGYSMGGGGVLNAGNDLGSAVDAIVAMAPYNPENRLNGVEADTLIMVGSNDLVASPLLNAEPAYNDLPDTIDKCLMEFRNFGHLQWVNNNSSSADTPKLLASDWLDMAMNGNTSKISTFLNPPFDVVLNRNNL
jgi:hypothetical protein